MKTSNESIISLNRKATHEYFLEERLEAGLALFGWEVKSLREGKAQLKESYIVIKRNEAWLLGAHFSPPATTAKQSEPDPTRTRKLLLHRKEINKLIGLVERKGYTIIPVKLFWHRNKAKLEIAVAKGKQLHDKRQSEKDKDWEREKAQLMRQRS